MRKGSLLDHLIFEQDDQYEIVDARYKSGPREGEECTDWTGKEAREVREAILARGLTPALSCEVEALLPLVGATQKRICELVREMGGGPGGYDHEVIYQPQITWTTRLGEPARGEPDVVVLVFMRDLIKTCTIDVKHTAMLQPKKFNRQVFDMGWDVQGAAYSEGVPLFYESERGIPAFHMDHVILATSSVELGLPPCARRLSPAYRAIGLRRWEKAQREWRRCLDSNTWPGYPEDDAEPSFYLVRTELEQGGDLKEEDVEP